MSERAFLGHPRGLAYLAFTEMWERFSFYGMQSLLVLYMTQELFLAEKIERVAGIETYRWAAESVLGPLSTQALAGQTFGLYAGLVYFTPLFGGWIADRWLGAKRTVVIGVLLMTAGHAAMVFDASFLIALLLLILGSGALKGNIAAQVGQLYPPDDERMTSAYAIFSTFINIGAILGPVACGLLAQVYGWHYGFGLAGLLMLAALGVYLRGADALPDAVTPRSEELDNGPITSAEGRSIGLLAFIYALMVVVTAGFDQTFNMGMVWINATVDLETGLGRFPVAWFVAVNSTAIVVLTTLTVIYWRALARRGAEPSDTTKIALGGLFTGTGVALLAVADAIAGDGKVGIALPVLSFIVTGLGFAWYWPTALAIAGRYAPPRFAARMMAAAYLTVFFSNMFGGYIATLYETMNPTVFWSLNAGFCFAGGALFLAFGPALTRALATSRNDAAGEAVIIAGERTA